MKKLLLVITLAVSIVGCDSGAQGINGGALPIGGSNNGNNLKGVGQGNGMTAGLYFASYSFGMNYSKDLALIKNNEKSFEINNSKLIQSNNDTSKFEFEIVEDGSIESAQDLKDIARINHPSENFKSVKYNNFGGISSENKSTEAVKRIDYVLISKGIYVKSRTKAFKNGDGFKKIEPIIKTITSDHTAPYLINLKLGKEKFLPGDDLTLELEGVDNVSGIKEGCCAAIFLKEQPNNIFKDSNGVNGRVRKIQNAQFGVSNFAINKFAEAGVYTIERFYVQDVAGNQASLEINSEDPQFYKLNGTINTKIKVLKFEIVDSSQTDTEYPKITNLSLKKSSLKAGDDLVIEFMAKDDVSGVELGCCSAVFFKEYPNNVFKDSDGVNGRVGSLGGKNYEVTNLPINKHAKSGKYTIERFSIQDNAGNQARLEIDPARLQFYRYDDGKQTNIKVLEFEIVKNDQEDLKHPEIKSFSLSKSEFSPGEDLVVIFEAEDDVSGVELGCCSGVFLKEYPSNVFRNSDGVNGRVEKIKEGKFKVTNLPINEFADSGEYTIARFSIQDNAGNATRLEIDPDNTSFYRYESGVKTTIRVLSFKVK